MSRYAPVRHAEKMLPVEPSGRPRALSIIKAGERVVIYARALWQRRYRYAGADECGNTSVAVGVMGVTVQRRESSVERKLLLQNGSGDEALHEVSSATGRWAVALMRR